MSRLCKLRPAYFATAEPAKIVNRAKDGMGDKVLRKIVQTEKHSPPCPSYTAKNVFPSAEASSRLRTAVCASSIAARDHVSTDLTESE